MSTFAFSRYALSIGAAVVLLAGCGGTQPPIGAPGVMPQSRAIVQHADRGGSWMLPEAKGEDLVYAVDGCYGTCVFAYPSGKYVGAIAAQGSAACSDQAGDVFFPDGTTVTEYAHGGQSPIATLSLPGVYGTGGCSIDPATGNLAVVYSGKYGNVAIFPNAQGQPMLYTTGQDSQYVAYGEDGDLFVNSFVGQNPGLAELPAGGSTFDQISVPQIVNDPGQLQWDGTYLAWESGEARGPRIVSRLNVSGSQATIVSQRRFHDFMGESTQAWIFKNRIILPYAHAGVHPTKIGVWAYPTLGRELKAFDVSGKRDDFQGVTISVAPSR